MNIQVSAHKLQLTEPLKAYAEKRLAACLSPLVENSATQVQVMLSTEPGVAPRQAMVCRVNLHIPKEGQVVVTKSSDDMYKSIDMVHDTLLSQTKHLLERHHDMHRIRKDAERDRTLSARQTMTTFEDADHAVDLQTAREVAAFEHSQDAARQLL